MCRNDTKVPAVNIKEARKCFSAKDHCNSSLYTHIPKIKSISEIIVKKNW